MQALRSHCLATPHLNAGILGILQQYSTDEKTITIIRDIPKHKQVHKSKASVSHSPVDESLKPEPFTVSSTQKDRDLPMTMPPKAVITAPPGKIGLVVVDAKDGESGTVVSKVKDDSPLSGKIRRGDRIVDINGVDVHNMSASGKTI